MKDPSKFDEFYSEYRQAYITACRKHMYDEIYKLKQQGLINNQGVRSMFTDILPMIDDMTYHKKFGLPKEIIAPELKKIDFDKYFYKDEEKAHAKTG